MAVRQDAGAAVVGRQVVQSATTTVTTTANWTHYDTEDYKVKRRMATVSCAPVAACSVYNVENVLNYV